MMPRVLKKVASIFNLISLPRIVLRQRNLLWQLVKRQIQQRYQGSVLGLVWSFVQPLMMLLVYTFVFSVVFNAKWGIEREEGRGTFAIVMFCGMTMFTLFSEAVGQGCLCIVNNQNLVKKVVFPIEILPVAQVLVTYTIGLVWILLLFIGSIVVLGFCGWTMLLLPLVMLPLVLFTLGISFFLASLGVYIRDTSYVVGVVLQMLFFATPIFYPISAVPKDLRWILECNPLTVFIEQARRVFLYGMMPDWGFLGIAAVISVVVLQLGFFFFSQTKRGFADVL